MTSLDSLTLRSKLLSFLGLACFLIAAITAISIVYFSKIENANRHKDTELERSNNLKDSVSAIVQRVLSQRVTEKSYQQFYTEIFPNAEIVLY